MTTSLIPIESINAIEVFTGANLDDLLARIRNETATFVPDVSTAGGRKEIGSIAYKIARSKTAIDDAGKELVSEWKKKSSEVDAARKKARDYLDDLKDDVRAPLTAWEEEQTRIERERVEAEECAKAEAEAARIAEIDRREAEIRAKEEAIRAKEEAERQRAAKEQAAREQAEREARIAAEAEARAKEEAAEAVARAERQADEAKRAAEFAAAEADRRQAAAVLEARQRAEREAEEREQARLAEEDRVRAEEGRRAANRAHRQKVNAAALKALIDAGIAEDAAKLVITLIASSKVPAISITY